MSYPRAGNDAQRVDFLHSLRLLDNARSEALDRITAMASTIFSVPTVTISLVDSERQWFASHHGLDACETDRDVAFCNYTIMSDKIFEVTDASVHPDFKDNPLVTGDLNLRYYCGTPLIVHDYRIGAFCLIDYQPRPALDESQRQLCHHFAELVCREIQMGRLVKEMNGTIMSLLNEAGSG